MLYNVIASTVKKSFSLSLLPIKKRLIYLDQNFYSHAFRKGVEKFDTMADRLRELSRKQLIVCPYSDTHDKETHLLSPNIAEKLLEFIRKLSRGHRFCLQIQIEERQIINAYFAFIKRGLKITRLGHEDAFLPDLHDWEGFVHEKVGYSGTNFVSSFLLLRSKEDFCASFMKALPIFRNSTSSFEDDYALEIRDHARFIFEEFLKLTVENNLEKIMKSQNHRIIHTLLDLNLSGEELKEKIDNVKNFLKSEYFLNIPSINISSGLWAIIKQEIKSQQFSKNKRKIMNQIRGLHQDIEHLSIYAPYCDAIFPEINMAMSRVAV